MLSYFMFRMKQPFRYLSAAGGSLLVLVPFVLLVLFYAGKVLAGIGLEGTQLVVILALLSVGLKRRDLAFLRSVFKNRILPVLLVEYSVLYMLLELFALSAHPPDIRMAVPFLAALAMATGQTMFRGKIRKFHFVRKLTCTLPLHAFEWRSGIRQSSLLFLSSYVMGLFLTFFFPITPVMMLYWMTFSGDFYGTLEDRGIVQSYRMRAHFYAKKIKSLLIACNLQFLSHYVLFVFLYNGAPQIGLLLASVLLFNMVFVYAFLLKYALQTIGNKVQNTIPITLFFISTAVLPVSSYLIYKAWRKNRKKLGLLLN